MKSLLQLTKAEVWFLLCAALGLFCITMEYTITRPISYSLFISYFGVKWIPFAWIALVPLNWAIVVGYNRLLSKVGHYFLFLISISSIIAISLLSSLLIPLWHPLSFFLFVWKDIYVLLMFQQIWSVIHVSTSLSKAKALYGLLFSLGGLGSAVGSLLPTFCAETFGSERLLLATTPIYLAFLFIYRKMIYLRSKLDLSPIVPEAIGASGGVRLIRQEKMLLLILTIVVFMQVCSATFDYQFSTFLESAIGTKDARSAFAGKVYLTISSIKFFFQLIGTFLLVHFFGLRMSHFVVPLILLMNAVATFLFPVFRMATFAFVTIKAFDYSIFNILKEMLYIPLKLEAKFQAKAIIDIFAYRSSKAIASVLIIALNTLHVEPNCRWISSISIVFLTGWLIALYTLYRSDIITKDVTNAA